MSRDAQHDPSWQSTYSTRTMICTYSTDRIIALFPAVLVVKEVRDSRRRTKWSGTALCTTSQGIYARSAQAGNTDTLGQTICKGMCLLNSELSRSKGPSRRRRRHAIQPSYGSTWAIYITMISPTPGPLRWPFPSVVARKKGSWKIHTKSYYGRHLA